MEKFPPPALSSSVSQTLLKKYHQLTSPVVSLHVAKQQETLKEQLKKNVNMKLDCIKNRGTKIFALDTSQSYSDLKAGAIMYQIPEFSTPQVNYEVADQIKKRVSEMKNEIINHLPEISKSSNYAPRKIEHQLSHRSAVRQLEEWLKQKLRKPPQNYEESLQYKNMIMGIGMKQLIRIIGKRCNEEGRMAEDIWQLTWSICRQIIVYLSKRANKCEQLLQQELQFMRLSYQKQFERLKQQVTELSVKVTSLQQENKEYLDELIKLRKRRGLLEDENKSLTYDNFHIQQEFRNVLEQNLAIYLQIGDKNKRGWIKKMYKNINTLTQQSKSTLKGLFKKQVTNVVEERVKLEEVTGDCEEKLSVEEIQKISQELQESLKQKEKSKAKKIKKHRNSKTANKDNQIANETMITQLQAQINEQDQIEQNSDDDCDSSCDDLVNNMREQFKPIDAWTQSESKKLVHTYASTVKVQFAESGNGVKPEQLIIFEEMGVNTQEVKQQKTNIIKKKGKENDSIRAKSKSKLFTTSPISKQRSKGKPQKKLTHDIMKEQLPIRQSIIEQEQDDISNTSDLPSQIQNVRKQSHSMTMVMPETSNDKKLNNLMMCSEGMQKFSQSIYMPPIIEEPSVLEIKEAGIINSIDVLNVDKKQKISVEQNKAVIKITESQIINIVDNNLKYTEVSNNSSVYGDDLTKTMTGVLNRQAREQSKLQALKECTIYICAECNKIITQFDQKFENTKLKSFKNQRVGRYSKHAEESKKHESPCDSLKKLGIVSPEHTSNDENQNGSGSMRRDFDARKGRRNMTRKSSGYMHDISFKKDMEDQLQIKGAFFANDETKDRNESIQELQQTSNIYAKLSPYKLLYGQIKLLNKDFTAAIVNTQLQVTQSLQHYLEMVKQINALPENKIIMSQKLVIATIQKNIFPIINQLLLVVKKAVKYNRIGQTMKTFTSLPNIIYNRISRKYGVKILAIKNLKILLMALKAASKYTEKYKIIELMMFTDCKSPHSEDLFIYLLIMGLLDPSFSSNRLLNHQQSFTIRKLCEQHLTKQQKVYLQFDRMSKQDIDSKQQGLVLVDLIKSVITNYRLFKIHRIQQLGFIFLMLKKDYWMEFKQFVYFISMLQMDNTVKVAISKKLLEYCDVNNRDRKIGISENMFSKFLMNCHYLDFAVLQKAAKQQLQNYNKQKEIVNHLSHKFFITKKNIKTTNHIANRQDTEEQSLNKTTIPAQDVSVEEGHSILQININEGEGQKVEKDNDTVFSMSKTKVLKQVKEYSSFTYQICSYLQNIEQTKFLTHRQTNFIKDYLIIHLIQNQLQKVIGLVDYFSNSLLQLVCIPPEQFSINNRLSNLSKD